MHVGLTQSLPHGAHNSQVPKQYSAALTTRTAFDSKWHSHALFAQTDLQAMHPILTYDVCATSSMPDGAIQFAANIIDAILCVEFCLAVGRYNQSHRVN